MCFLTGYTRQSIKAYPLILQYVNVISATATKRSSAADVEITQDQGRMTNTSAFQSIGTVMGCWIVLTSQMRRNAFAKKMRFRRVFVIAVGALTLRNRICITAFHPHVSATNLFFILNWCPAILPATMAKLMLLEGKHLFVIY